MSTIGKGMKPFKINELVEIIMQKKALDFTTALYYLYTSDFFSRLTDENTKFWYLGGLSLYEILEEEKQKTRKQKTSLPKISLFLIFCIENFAEIQGKTSEETVALFDKYTVFQFLTKNFDVLHTQGQAYIIDEIKLFIKNRTK
ncbi:MAG: DUF3791 domain-containing protein [Prevotellaceae bacterium]|nr:DUF3791 domain-containing protein [Prevotellaceae bacterium]